MSLRDTLRVMVVDDMSISRALISQSLDDLGISHYIVENDSRTALGKLVAQPVHLVISDMNMPGLTGLQLLEALRHSKPTQKIGFILITGSPTPDIIRTGQELGLNNLIRKPFTTATIRASIESVFGKL